MSAMLKIKSLIQILNNFLDNCSGYGHLDNIVEVCIPGHTWWFAGFWNWKTIRVQSRSSSQHRHQSWERPGVSKEEKQMGMVEYWILWYLLQCHPVSIDRSVRIWVFSLHLTAFCLRALTTDYTYIMLCVSSGPWKIVFLRLSQLKIHNFTVIFMLLDTLFLSETTINTHVAGFAGKFLKICSNIWGNLYMVNSIGIILHYMINLPMHTSGHLGQKAHLKIRLKLSWDLLIGEESVSHIE